MRSTQLPKLFLTCLGVAVISTALACGSPSGNDGGSGGGSGGSGGSGGGSGGSGGGTGGGSGGSGGGGGGSGGGSGGSGGGTGACTPSAAPILVDAGCSTTIPGGACGGALPGTWCYTSYCLDPAVLPNVAQACSQARYTTITGTVTGTTVFTGTATAGSVARSAAVDLTAAVDFPPPCLDGGFFSLTCAQLQSGLAGFNIAATCNDSGDGGCICSRVINNNLAETGTYTTSGNVLSVATSDGGSKTYDYCVAGSTMRYHETTSNPDERAVGSLAK